MIYRRDHLYLITEPDRRGSIVDATTGEATPTRSLEDLVPSDQWTSWRGVASTRDLPETVMRHLILPMRDERRG